MAKVEREDDLQQLARRFEANQDDLDQWETTPRKIRGRRGGPSQTFSVRFAPEEMELLQRAADERDITISELIRSAALASAGDQREAVLRDVKDKARELAEVVSRL